MSCDVLLVDDDDATREALCMALVDDGLSVATAQDGEGALRMLHNVRPKAILVDLMMPVMNGWMFLDSIRRDPKYESIPVVMMSASSTPWPSGCNRLLRKPFREGELESALAPYVGRIPRGHS